MNRTRLSVNLNKVALIRNARGGNLPDLIQFAKDCEHFGAEGITVHPRPDERHIRYSDIPKLKEVVTTELNIEGNPTTRFIEMVLEHRPDQVTLVPDAPDALTSDSGWDTLAHQSYLSDLCERFHEAGIRVSIFLDPDPYLMESAKQTGTDRIELYTGGYAYGYVSSRDQAIEQHIRCAQIAQEVGLGLNAGHDLNLENLKYYAGNVPGLLEVSIGHALISDSLYYGIQNTIQMYKSLLRQTTQST